MKKITAQSLFLKTIVGAGHARDYNSCSRRSRAWPAPTAIYEFSVSYFLIGVLFMMICLVPFPVQADQTTLARELFEEKNYRACIVECERGLAENPENLFWLQLKQNAATQMAATEKGETSGFFTWPFLRLIGFYKKQISPALGERCGLYPSCSSYGFQVIKQHGLLGLAMTADRLVREPTVIKESRNLAVVNGNLKISDPMEDHDFWFNTTPHEK